jgi:uncharacterized protein YjbI with pentapeptide repeats
VSDGHDGSAGAGSVAPTDSRIDRADWYEADLSAVTHERVLFQDLDMTDSTGAGARFVDCTFRGAQLDRCALDAASFENCTFVRCSFTAARFTGCKFLGSRFDSAAAQRMTVEGGDWSFVGLAGADLRRARLTDVRMREVDLAGADLGQAVLTNCDLAGATWSRADLTGCDLRGSDISDLEPGNVLLRRAVIDWPQAALIARGLGLDVRAD